MLKRLVTASAVSASLLLLATPAFACGPKDGETASSCGQNTSCDGAKGDAAVKVTKAADTKASNLTLSVAGWSCGSCADHTVAELKKLDGVTDATADLDAKTVAVQYDGKTATADAIKKAIAAAGYTVVDNAAQKKS